MGELMKVYLLSGFIEAGKSASMIVVALDVNKAQEELLNTFGKNLIDLRIKDLTQFLNEKGFIYQPKEQ